VTRAVPFFGGGVAEAPRHARKALPRTTQIEEWRRERESSYLYLGAQPPSLLTWCAGLYASTGARSLAGVGASSAPVDSAVGAVVAAAGPPLGRGAACRYSRRSGKGLII